MLLILTLSLAAHTGGFKYDPAGQAQAHAALWTLWQQHDRNSCARRLERGQDLETPLAATHGLMYQLVGDREPEPGEEPERLPPVVAWDDPGELPPRLRESLAWHVEGWRHAATSYYKNLHFGHVVRGADPIMKYTEGSLVLFDQTLPAMEKMKRKMAEDDKGTTARRLLHHGPFVLVYPAIGAYLGHFLDQSMLWAAAGAVLASKYSFPLYFIRRRFLSYFQGDECYRSNVYGTLEFNRSFSPVLLAPNFNRNFYTEASFDLESDAFFALRENSKDAMERLEASCKYSSVHSPSQENTAYFQMIGIDRAWGEIDTLARLTRLMISKMRSDHEAITVRTTMATLYFRDPENGEPVLVNWLRFRLFNGGWPSKKKKRAAETETEKSGDWGWKPAFTPHDGLPFPRRTR